MDSSFLAVYGSLRRRSLFRRGLRVGRSLTFFGHGILRGQAFVQNGYPGAIEGAGAIQVEIFRVRDQAVFQVLDLYEGFSPELRDYSLFYRKVVRLLHPEILATAYFLARQTPRGEKVHKIRSFGGRAPPAIRHGGSALADSGLSYRPTANFGIWRN